MWLLLEANGEEPRFAKKTVGAIQEFPLLPRNLRGSQRLRLPIDKHEMLRPNVT